MEQEMVSNFHDKEKKIKILQTAFFLSELPVSSWSAPAFNTTKNEIFVS